MRYRIVSSSIALLLCIASAASSQAKQGAASHAAPGDGRAHGAHDQGQRDTLSAADSALVARGKEIVTTVCAACHTEQAPPKLAPPLAHVSHRYRMQLGTRDSALARMTAWIKDPSRDRALMPAMAIERFGLMAPLPLPEDMRRAAAAYVWSLSEGEAGMEGMRGMQGMQGMKHGRGAGDTLVTPRRKGESIVP